MPEASPKLRKSCPRPRATIELVRNETLTPPLMRPIVAVVFFTYVAQNLLNTSLAPLARSLGLAEWQMGATLSLAAVMVASLSQWWGRRAMRFGPRTVLMTALCLTVASSAVFVSSAVARTAGLIGAGVAAAGIILARGGLFGAAVAAVPPTAQAIIAAHTPSEQARIKGMAAFSAAVNISIMVGGLASALLASIHLLGPVVATPVCVVTALVIGWIYLPRSNRAVPKAVPPKVSPWDRRILPYLASGFGMFVAGGIIQITLGFLLQDRYALSPQHAILATGLIMLAQSAGAMVTQLVVVPRLGWRPRRLLRVGLVLQAAAICAYLWIPPLPILAGAACALGVGAGIAGPGYTAGGSLAVSQSEQGGVAGVLNATSAVTWIFAPFLGTVIYGAGPLVPIIVSLCTVLASAAVPFIHRSMR